MFGDYGRAIMTVPGGGRVRSKAFLKPLLRTIGFHSLAALLPPGSSGAAFALARSYGTRAFPLRCTAGEPVREGGEGWFARS